jgi:PAB-dependent poly(A)-specific ribonuclease subunit 2
MSHKATCQNCKVVRTFESNRFVATSDLPPVLAVNANVYNEETLEHWLDTRKQTFLAPTVELSGQLYEGEESTHVTYNLRVRPTLYLQLALILIPFQAIVVQVLSKEGRPHLVAIVKSKCSVRSTKSNLKSTAVPEVGDAEGSFSPWFVFNDFSVQNISEEEALSFPGKWKVRPFSLLKLFAHWLYHRFPPSCI